MANNNVKNVSKVIFKFVSSKGNVVYKLNSTAVDVVSGEILEGAVLISESNAKMFNKKYGWEIKEIVKTEDGQWVSADDLDKEPEIEEDFEEVVEEVE